MIAHFSLLVDLVFEFSCVFNRHTNQFLPCWARVGVRRALLFFGGEAIKANQKGPDALVAACLTFQTSCKGLELPLHFRGVPEYLSAFSRMGAPRLKRPRPGKGANGNFATPNVLPGYAGSLQNAVSGRVVWVGDRDEAGDSRSVQSRENAARIDESLREYIQANAARPPLGWFSEADAVLAWRRPIEDPVHVLLSAMPGLQGDALAERLLNAETLPVLLEAALQRQLRNNDTCGEIPSDRLIANALFLLESALPSPSPCSETILAARMEDQRAIGLEALSRVSDGSRSYVSTAKRGIRDRILFKFLMKRTDFWRVPEGWGSDDGLTREQALVFDEILRQLRCNGWSVLSGPGGAGKTHMLRTLARLALQNKCISSADHRADVQSVENAQELSSRIYFLGPTNRSVAVLEAALHDFTRDSTMQIEALVFGTVHSIARRALPFEAHLVIIDEASMLSAEHGDLLMNCPSLNRASLLLVGDHLQLPPVGEGELLRPLLTLCGAPVLTRNLRAANAGLGFLVDSVREGRVWDVLAHERHCSCRSDLLQRVEESGCQLVLAYRNEERVRYNMRMIQKRPLGNARLCSLDDYRKHSAESWTPSDGYPRAFVPFVGMPVRMQTNDYRPTACRGALGQLVRVQLVNRSWNLEAQFGSEVVSLSLPFYSIPDALRPAFATTLHDAQGAQSQRVGILLPPSARCPLLTLESLYTAASRAQEEVMFFTQGDMLEEMAEVLKRASPLRLTPLAVLARQVQQVSSAGRHEHACTTHAAR